MPPSLAVCSPGQPPSFDPLGFKKYMKNIGRAYRKQAMELISICRLFVQAGKQIPGSDMKLREALNAVDEALERAAEAKKKTSPEADEKFKRAVTSLSGYEKNYHPGSEVAKRMEKAKLNDTSSSTIISRLFHAKPTEDRCSEPTTVVEFLLHKSLPDGSPTIVKQVLSKRSNLQEIFWNFGRMKGKKRLTLKQNPHFYKHLPESREAYDHQFQTDPMKDFVQAPRIYVLTDKPGRVFLETEQNTRAFGNFWTPNGAIIFKDVCGKLEGDSIVGASIEATSDIWYREELSPSPTSPSGVRPTAVPSLPAIITTSPINSPTGDWKELLLRMVDYEHINIRISTKAPELLEGWTLHSPIKSGPNSPGSPSPTRRVIFSGALALSIAPSRPVLTVQIPSPSLGPLTASYYYTASLLPVSPRLPSEPGQEAPALQSPTLPPLPSQQPSMGSSSSPTALSAPLSNEPPTQAPPQPPELGSQQDAPAGEMTILSRTRIPIAGGPSYTLTEAVASFPDAPNLPGPPVEGSEAESGGNPPRQADVPSPEQERATSPAPNSGATSPSQQAEDVRVRKKNWFRKYVWDYKRHK